MSYLAQANAIHPRQNTRLAGRFAVSSLLLILLVVVLSACGGPSGSSGGGQGTVSTLSPRIFILGTQVDMLGNLRIFVHGLDAAGTPLTLADYETATVTVAGVPYAVTAPPPGDVTVKRIDPNEPLMSLALVTDYSESISDADLDRIALVNDTILTSLPAIFEGAVFNFSDFDDIEIPQDWTNNLAALQAAVLRDATFPRNNTALYDAMGIALERGMVMNPDGLIERCRPIRMMVVHTDGEDNDSVIYDKPTLLTLIEDSRTIPIMLGTLAADAMELFEFAGERGAFVYDDDLAGIEAEVAEWVGSFGVDNLVEFNLTPATGFNPVGPVQIALGNLTVMVAPPYDQSCTP